MNQRILYFTAAALFVVAAAISVVNDGVSLKVGLGLMTGAIMVWLGFTKKDPVN
jgi:hypothetical protein